MRVGVIGCGAISRAYVSTFARLPEAIRVTACADLFPERAQAIAAEFGAVAVASPAELLTRDDVDAVLNLTIPAAHVEVGLQAIAAGKHLYGEKPLALDRAGGQRLLDAAAAAGVVTGSAPDTVLGAGIQTCRHLIDEGAIGEPVGAAASMLCPGHESWHPDPGFYYKLGGGPMFDMGPYYLSAMVTLLGPVARVAGATRITWPTRTITSQPKHGEVVDVEVPTHVAAVMQMASGPIATITTSFDVQGSRMPCFELYGTEGTLSVPDPNTFGGPVLLRSKGTREWREIPLVTAWSEQNRGIGVADMADALAEKRLPRASGELAHHVVDVMQSIHEAHDTGTRVELTTTCERPLAVPAQWEPGKSVVAAG